MKMLTIMIPTMNRPDFLERVLRYYAANEFPWRLFIGDASVGYEARQVKDVVEKYRHRLPISHFDCRGVSIAETIHRLNEALATPYATLICDDDFVIPGGLQECIDFLKKNQEYEAANGTTVVLTLQSDGAYGKLKDAGYYRLGGSEGASGAKRLLAFLSNYYVTLFSVHRAETWKAMWQDVDAIKDVPFQAELLPNCLAVVKGKVKHLKKFYIIRQHHDRRYFVPDIFDWLTSPDWFESYTKFSHHLSQGLAVHDGIPLKEAQAIVKQAFWFYLKNSLTKKYNQRYTAKRKSLKSVLQQIPLLEKIAVPLWNVIKDIRCYLTSTENISLSSLTKPSSPFYKDFMPVYDLLTQGAEKF